ncbi:hypothetical protein Tcan_00483, partial [Toxocara canis]
MTIYAGLQVRHPETGSYIFPEYEWTKEISMMNLEPEISRLFSAGMQSFEKSHTKSTPDQSKDLQGLGTKKSRAKTIRPYALYALRVVYRTSFNLKDASKLLALKSQIGSFYGIARSETIPPDYPIEFQTLMSQRSCIGSQIINTALVAELKAATDSVAALKAAARFIIYPSLSVIYLLFTILRVIIACSYTCSRLIRCCLDRRRTFIESK